MADFVEDDFFGVLDDAAVVDVVDADDVVIVPVVEVEVEPLAVVVIGVALDAVDVEADAGAAFFVAGEDFVVAVFWPKAGTAITNRRTGATRRTQTIVPSTKLSSYETVAQRVEMVKLWTYFEIRGQGIALSRGGVASRRSTFHVMKRQT